jgi:hypothetical protein
MQEFTYGPWVAGVGSREVPESILEIMIRLGRTYTDLGFQMSSGDAWDSDRAFLYGAKQSRRYSEVGARVYLNKDGVNRRYVEENPFYIDASKFDSTTQATARSMACYARDGFGGLNEFGIQLHTRNVYQIHGESLTDTISAIWFYAEPDGRNKVSGGTNTAFQLAKIAKVPLIENLYYADTVERALKWLDENEQPYPYDDIHWHEIHKPNDPRLSEFD